MRTFEIPTSKAKVKLLNAAETQVAHQGFDAVSVRDVTQLAKANVAAVNYHFGSREGMMSLMMIRRMSPIHEEQLQNLDLLEKKKGNKAAALEELLDAWLSPLFLKSNGSSDNDELLRYSVARILQTQVKSLPEQLQSSGDEVWRRYVKAYTKSLREVPAQEIAWRMHFLIGCAVQSLLGPAAIQPWADLDSAGSSHEQRLSRLLRLAAPMMREGGVKIEEDAKPKGPQGTFDF